jgi:hypothetical protein
MIRPSWTSLDENDREAFRATVAFLEGRLEERGTVNWALKLKPNDTIKRLALLELVDSPYGRKISEPWRSAWRLIKDSWSSPVVEGHGSSGVYDAQERLVAGDRSGSLVTTIVELVAPRLKIEPFTSLSLRLDKTTKRPTKVEDLLSTRLTSGQLVDIGVLKLGVLTEGPFLVSLAHALDAIVATGLDMGRSIGWDGERRLWRLGQLHRVYYVPASERTDLAYDPDRFHRGIAPSVKLLHTVVSRLVYIDISGALDFVRRWKLTNSPIHLRLWAALSRDSRVTSSTEVASTLLALDNRRFWDLDDYPEIAELRAKRFSGLDSDKQTLLTARIRKRPPRNQWPRKADPKHVENARTYRAVRELRRIEIAGARLPMHDKTWLDERIPDFPDLAQMVRLQEGFLDSLDANLASSQPDRRYDLLSGKERLEALEAALSSSRSGWADNPREHATDWIRQAGNPVLILSDFESIPNGGAAFARVWNRFGWAHAPGGDDDKIQRNLVGESARVLSLLIKLPESTLRDAIEGISQWLSVWQKQVVVQPEGFTVWFKVWPIAVDITNAQQPLEEEPDLNTIVQSSDDTESKDLDTLNTPAGKLVGVFLASCPNLRETSHPFELDGTLRTMRDAIITAPSRAGLIARHRMIEALSYFLNADREWTQKNVITPLISDTPESLALWRAIARQARYSNVIKIVGGTMAERATDSRLGRETRSSLVFSLFIECLHAFREQREPSVPYVRIQQMIRSLDDEVRAHGAEAVHTFVHDVSAPNKTRSEVPSPEALFRTAVAPFLQHVWPQERSLATPGVSRAFAKLPAVAQEAFAEVVEAIEPFLVPFECWSLIDYGLYGEENGEPKLSSINSRDKAAALLRLLDLTIGTAEGSVIPHHLAEALDQVRRVAPNLGEGQVFRRLATAARRR